MSDLQKMDLSGVFYIQQQYLTDLSAISANVPVTQYLTPLQQQLNEVYNSFAKANVTSSDVLDHQDQMNAIIQNENARLNKKKSGVDSALFSQRRLIELNESYRKKNLQYIKILVIIVFTILIYLALLLIRRNFTFIPAMLTNVLIATTLSVSIIYIIIMLSTISKRDEMNYDKLKLSAPSTSTSTTTSTTTTTDSSYGNTLSTGICNGEECCDSTTTWDDASAKCVIKTEVDGFAIVGNNKVENTVTFQPYIPSEFDSYSKLQDK